MKWIRVNWWLLRFFSDILLQHVWPTVFQTIVPTFSEKERGGWFCRCFFFQTGRSICWSRSVGSIECFVPGHWMKQSLWSLCFIMSKKGKVFPVLLSFLQLPVTHRQPCACARIYCVLLWVTETVENTCSSICRLCGVLQLWWIKEGFAKYLDSAEETMGYHS